MSIHDACLPTLLTACQTHCPKAQRELYRRFRTYGLNVCRSYTKCNDQAQEVFNDAFLKVFRYLPSFEATVGFQAWLRRILVNSAIDHLRRGKKHRHTACLDNVREPSVSSRVEHRLALEQIIALIDELPPTYRFVYFHFVVEGWKHTEIARALGITVGTSKSNLAKARRKMRALLQRLDPPGVTGASAAA